MKQDGEQLELTESQSQIFNLNKLIRTHLEGFERKSLVPVNVSLAARGQRRRAREYAEATSQRAQCQFILVFKKLR